MNRSARLALLSIWTLAACGGEPHDAEPAPEVGPPSSAYSKPPSTLEGWNLFADAPRQRPGPRTVPYEVISPLFADYALKQRFVYVPEGETIGYDPEDYWTLPSGSILIKTFLYPADLRQPEADRRLLETRLIVFTDDDVQVHTYVWDQAQREATRKVAGATLPVEWTHFDGEQRENDYRVPNTNQCLDCHGKRGETHTLGLRTRQMDRDDQLEHFTELDLFDRTPEPPEERERLVDPFGDASLSDRARSYLDSNCSQCHTQGGDASKSGMWIDWKHTAADQPRAQWGVCKRPTSASGATCGNEVDIAPGEPERSIYLCRLESTDSKVQMPPLGRNLLHDEAVALIRDWIAALPPGCDD
ncbi:MAG TPA: hypothetical protein VJR89_38930 [Polyangiales bacterium]|nr:hypothetical protein [Polyangiales bacterium]